jgi:hypothetical protein
LTFSLLLPAKLYLALARYKEFKMGLWDQTAGRLLRKSKVKYRVEGNRSDETNITMSGSLLHTSI